MDKLSEDDYFKLTHHEDGLIHHRLTWLLAGQPLLFLAYANVIGLRKPGDNQPFQPEHEAAIRVIPWVGGLMAVGVFLGILGAVIACNYSVIVGNLAECTVSVYPRLCWASVLH